MSTTMNHPPKSPRLQVVVGSLVEVVASGHGFPILTDTVVIPDGTFVCNGDTCTLDTDGAAAIVKKFEERRVDMVVDFEHLSMREDHTGPIDAAGWIKEIRHEPGRGIVARIRWVGSAPDRIRELRYRYLSPVFYKDKKTNRVTGLHNVALTNEPGIDGFPAIAAAAARKGIMADAPADTTEQDTTRSMDTIVSDIRAALSLPEDATGEDVLEAALQRIESSNAADVEAVPASVKPVNRTAVIANARKKFNANPRNASITTRAAFVNLKLDDGGHNKLTDAERVQFG